MTIETCRSGDALDIERLERECLSAPWTLPDIDAALKNPDYVILKAVKDGRVIGCGGVQIIAGEGNITNIAVAAPYRRQGTGDRLLEALKAQCAARGADKMYLEVYTGNGAAIALYEKHGFYKAYTRKNYYREGDAIVMTCEGLCSRSVKE